MAENKNFIDESSTSVLEDFFKTNTEYIEKGINAAFKQFTNNIFSTVNNTFTNLNADHEKKLDKNRELHEKNLEALNKDVNMKKEINKKMKNFLKMRKKTIMKIIEMKQRTKYSAIFFKGLKAYHMRIQNRILVENMLVQQYFPLKRIKTILNSWRNLTHLIIKSKIKAEYAKKFNESYLIVQEKYEKEVKRLTGVLDIIEGDIRKEITERKALSKLYDEAMNKGVDVFLKETNNFVGYSNQSTPKDRSLDNSKQDK